MQHLYDIIHVAYVYYIHVLHTNAEGKDIGKFRTYFDILRLNIQQFYEFTFAFEYSNCNVYLVILL